MLFLLISATLITATAGTCYGWPSPTLPYLQSPESSIPTTADQGSWIVSIMILCSALTPVPAAYSADRFGRKTTLLLGAIPFILGWILVIVARSVAALYVGRMFSGLGYGIVYTVAPMYTGEIATNEVRGALSTLITLMNKVSILIETFTLPYHVQQKSNSRQNCLEIWNSCTNLSVFNISFRTWSRYAVKDRVDIVRWRSDFLLSPKVYQFCVLILITQSIYLIISHVSINYSYVIANFDPKTWLTWDAFNINNIERLNNCSFQTFGFANMILANNFNITQFASSIYL